MSVLEAPRVQRVIALPSPAQLRQNSLARHGGEGEVGPLIAARRGRAYWTPEEHYECLVDSLVSARARWLDVGCGRDLLPMNPGLALALAERCDWLVGIDPSENVLANPLLDEREQTGIEDFRASEPFDLITLRMVVEHIERPRACALALSRAARPGGLVVVYTPHKYSLLSIVSAIVPQHLHHAVKRRLWGTEERDTFPAFYRMNTLRTLRQLFEGSGFRTAAARLLDDATVFHARSRLGRAELAFWSVLARLRLPYPERNILAVFERV